MNSNTKTPSSTGISSISPRAGAQGVGAAGRPPGRPQAVAVLLGVAKTERVDAFNRRVRLDEAAGVEHQLDPARRGEREVVLALRADVVVLLQVSREEGSPAGGALGEHPDRDAAFFLRKIVVAVLSFVPGHRAKPENTLSEPRVVCYAARVHFGAWHKISDARTAAPEVAGVLQTRAEGAMDYRSGRSAMVLYACSDPDETLRRFVAGARRASNRAGGQRGRALDPLCRGAQAAG